MTKYLKIEKIIIKNSFLPLFIVIVSAVYVCNLAAPAPYFFV